MDIFLIIYTICIFEFFFVTLKNNEKLFSQEIMKRHFQEDFGHQIYLANKARQLNLLPGMSSSYYSMIPNLLRKFRFNNFAIVDEWMNPVGSGLF